MNKPKICDILGIDVGEEFRVDKWCGIYKVEADATITGRFDEEDRFGKPQQICETINGFLLCNLIQNPSVIIRKNMQKSIEAAKGLIALGYNWIACDGNGDVYAYDDKPHKCDSSEIYVCSNEDEHDMFVVINEKLFENITYDSGPIYLKNFIEENENAKT